MQYQQNSDPIRPQWRVLFLAILIAAIVIGLMTWLVMSREINKIDRHLEEMENPASYE